MLLERLVYDFRRAIEAAKKNNEPGEFFRKFPDGQCDHACDILAQYLIDKEIRSINIMNGTYHYDYNGNSQSHTWLLVGDSVIDITGDQFRYCKEPLKNDTPVYIGPVTDYYRLFEVRPGDICKHIGLNRTWAHYHKLKTWYEIILQYLD
jgi:hypothetical protein